MKQLSYLFFLVNFMTSSVILTSISQDSADLAPDPFEGVSLSQKSSSQHKAQVSGTAKQDESMESPDYSNLHIKPLSKLAQDFDMETVFSGPDSKSLQAHQRIQKRNQEKSTPQSISPATIPIESNSEPTPSVQSHSLTPTKDIIPTNRYEHAKIIQKTQRDAYDLGVFKKRLHTYLTYEEIRHIKATWTTAEKEDLMNTWAEKINTVFYNTQIATLDKTHQTITQMLTIIEQIYVNLEEKKTINASISKFSSESILKRLVNKHQDLLQNRKILSARLQALKTKLIRQCLTHFTEKLPELNDLETTNTQALKDLKKITQLLQTLNQSLQKIQVHRIEQLKQNFISQYVKFLRLCSSSEIIFLTAQEHDMSTPTSNFPAFYFKLVNLEKFNPSESFKKQCQEIKDLKGINLPLEDVQAKVITNYKQRLEDLGFDSQKPLQEQYDLLKMVGIDWKTSRNKFKVMLQEALGIQPTSWLSIFKR